MSRPGPMLVLPTHLHRIMLAMLTRFSCDLASPVTLPATLTVWRALGLLRQFADRAYSLADAINQGKVQARGFDPCCLPNGWLALSVISHQQLHRGHLSAQL